MIYNGVDTQGFAAAQGDRAKFNLPPEAFLLLFVGGYYWAGLGTLWQEYQDRLRYNRQHRMEFETAR